MVLGNDLPKTAYLRHINEAWSSRIDIIENNLDEYDSALTALQIRDDEIYRSLFGMNTIPAEVRNAASEE